jgi:integrase
MKGCRTLTNEEIKSILNSLSNRDKTFVLVSLTFGTRVSETLSLTFKDFDGDFISIKSSKGSENTSFPIPQDIKLAIKNLKSESGEGDDMPIFLSKKGGSISRQHASRIIKSTCKALGITGKVNTHSFRKSFVTKIYELTGKDIAQTKVYSRHKNLSNLDYYIRTTQETTLVNQLSWS